MTNVALRHITKNFKNTTALNDVSFSINDSEFFVLLGPTGAGKTTLLRVIAGLEKPNEGSVVFDGKAVDTLSPADRDVAFVFQQYSLYPGMSVYDNLAFPLRSPLRQTPEPEIAKRVKEAAEKLRITHLLERKTAKLSGGEMQRVSIGRAIVRDPHLFLMDEPLSNLDAKLRESLRVELKHLQKKQNITTLFVTHDQIEALTMADRIGVLDEGHLIQVGSPNDIYDHPATIFVAQLVGTPKINLLDAARQNGSLYIKDTNIKLPLTEGIPLPENFVLGVRPEDIRIDSQGEFSGKVGLTEPLGVETIVHLQTEARNIVSIVTGITPFSLGDTVRFNIVRERLHYFNLEGHRIEKN